jgi:type II restriction enzyme
MNAKSPELWDDDRLMAKQKIISWLADSKDADHLRFEIETSTRLILENIFTQKSLESVISKNPEALKVLRSLTRRDIGTSQMATFLNVTTNVLESFEAGRKVSEGLALGAENILLKELDQGISGWILEGREPSIEEFNRTLWISSDRILRRSTSTSLRYKHEPRQLEKLENYLNSKGLKKIDGASIKDPRSGMPMGTYSFRVSIQGMTSDGLILMQTVDALIKPFSNSDSLLPIFLEAKSMTDEVNPNKRQKEEAQKVESAKRRWQLENERLNFVLLLGGTVPKRYLQVEAGSDLDWIWEHRVEDLDLLLDWYQTQ